MEIYQERMTRDRYHKRIRYYRTHKLFIHQAVNQRRQEMKRRNKKYSVADKE